MDAATPEAAACIIGLGNPGRQYHLTRHNLGFMVLEALIARWGAQGPKKAFSGEVWDARLGGQRVWLLAPMTFMNRSGQAAVELVRFYQVPLARVLVVLDDMALPPGRIRLRPEGSAGGHNGLSDVLARLGCMEVPRLRIGIGSPPSVMDGVDYVLGKMSEDELAIAKGAVDQACQAVEDWLTMGMDAAMSKHNRPASES
jgi:peptidyl-tRNA hydrolase, PTH1 family